MVLKELEPDKTIMEVRFTNVPFCVQTHGLPVGQTTRNKAGWAASKVGKVLVVDFRSQRAVWVTPFVWVKVLIDISKSLCPGFFFLELIGHLLGCNSSLKEFLDSVSTVDALAI